MIYLFLETGKIQQNRSRIDNAAVTRCRIVMRATRASSACSAASALTLRRWRGLEGFGSDMPEPCVNLHPGASPEPVPAPLSAFLRALPIFAFR